MGVLSRSYVYSYEHRLIQVFSRAPFANFLLTYFTDLSISLYSRMVLEMVGLASYINQLSMEDAKAVSYTHLDVYKRQYLKPVLIWGGSTSLVGFLVLKSQSKRSSDDNSGKANLINLSIVIFLVVVVSAIGIWVTDDKRKKKGFEYPKILKRLEEIPTSIDNEERLIKKLEAELLLVPVLLQKEKVEHVQPKTDIPLTDEKLVGPEFNEPAEINEIEA